MQRGSHRTQPVAAYYFIALTVFVLVILIITINGILVRIGAESNRARGLLVDWLALKSDYLAADRPLSAAAAGLLRGELTRCSRDADLVAFNPLLAAMRKLSPSARSEALLESRWEDLAAVVGPGIDPSPGGPASEHSRELLSLATSFETSLRDRIDMIGGFERNQRIALTILQQSSILAILALVGLGIWTSRAASRSEGAKTQLRDLIAATFRVQEEERKRIALDLHDSVAQEISSALMIARRLDENEAGDRSSLTASLKSTLDTLRQLSWQMRPPELERLGFRGAAIGLIEDFERRHDLQVALFVPDWNLAGLGESADLHMFRILQEALANVAKHAEADSLHVGLERIDRCLRLSIQDNGRGFDAPSYNRFASNSAHLGLAGMRERARLIGGELKIVSSPGRGTKVIVEVPCDQ